MRLWPKPEGGRPSGRGGPPGWGAWAPPALIALAALALRLIRLGEANLWWDEALAIWAVRKGFVGVTLWTAGDVHPPLYFWSLWAWVRLVGESPFAMRALSAVLGALTVLVVYWLGERVGGRTVGALGALLTASARFHVWWSQEMRMYVLAGLLLALSLYAFLRWLDTLRTETLPPARSSLGWLTVCWLGSLGALYTLYLSASVILVENLLVLALLLWRRGWRTRHMLWQWAASQALLLAALAPWLLLAWRRMPTWSQAEPFGLGMFVRLYATLLTTGVSTHIERYAWAVWPTMVVLLAGGALGIARAARRGIHPPRVAGLAVLALAATLPAGAIYLSTLPRGLFYTPHIEARYFVPYAPFFWILLATSVVALGRRVRALGYVAGAALIALSSAFLPGYYGERFLRDTLQTLTRAIVSQAQPGDAVLLDSGGRYPMFLYDYERSEPEVWRPPMMTVSAAEVPLTQQEVRDWMATHVGAYQRMWLAEVDVHLTDPERLIYRALADQFQVSATWPYAQNRLTLFSRDGQPPTLTPGGYRPQHALQAPVGEEGLLLGWELPASRLPQDGTVRLSLLWAQAPTQAMELALRSPQGQVVLRQQGTLAAGARFQRQQFDLPLGSAIAPGLYALELTPPLPGGAPLTWVRVEGDRRMPAMTAPQVQLGTRLGEAIVLEGYALHAAPGEGLLRRTSPDTVILDLYWRAEGIPAGDYTVFTHLLGAAYNSATQGPLWGQHDAPPGGAPTSQWRAGQTVVDRHVLTLAPEAPEGDYQIEVGLYQFETGARLPITSATGEPWGDHLLLETRLHLAAR